MAVRRAVTTGLVVALFSGCADDIHKTRTPSDVGEGIDTADADAVGADAVGADAGAGSDADVAPDADSCSRRQQYWRFTEERLHEDGAKSEYDHVWPIDSAGPDTVGAVVRDGELIIDANLPEEPPVGWVSVTIRIRTDVDGAIPGVHAFEEPDFSSATETSEAYAGSYAHYSVILENRPGEPFEGTQQNNSYGGEVALDTCPNEVGAFAIGRFVDAEFGFSFTYHSIMNGEFAFVVFESDGSLDCGEPTVCSY